MDKVILTPSVPVLAEYFGVPYRTMLRWSKEKNTNWRFKMYVYLVDRYRKENYKI